MKGERADTTAIRRLTEAQIATANRLQDQIGKCRAWITGYQAGSGNTVLEADSLRQVQLFLDEIGRPLPEDTGRE